MKGIFISLEGIEGTGKTTQARLLSEYLSKKGYESVLTEEPGGTAIGRRIREVVLSLAHVEMHCITELLLYNASRCQHVKEVIAPALNAGKVVITDRFTDSTHAYQGIGRGINTDFIFWLDKFVTGGLMPDLTLLLDIDVETGLKRNRGANKVDRLELEDLEFHKNVRTGFQAIAAKEPARVKVIDAADSIDNIHVRIVETVEAFLSAGKETA